MKKIELNIRLADASELIKDVADNLSRLLDEAEIEIELALDILEDFDDPRAKKFIQRHSIPTPPGIAWQPENLAGFKVAVPLNAFITDETVTRENA